MEERVGNICRKETRQIYVGQCQGRCSSYALEQLNLGDRVIPVIFYSFLRPYIQILLQT